MAGLLGVLAIGLTLAYPFLVYFGLQYLDPRFLIPLLLLVLALRWLRGGSALERRVQAVIAATLILLVLLFDELIGLKFYPVLVNAGFLGLFGASLIRPPTVIERLARLQQPVLSVAVVAYTRKVTLVWCAFFIVNGLISAATALFASEQIWMLYNGFVAYLLMALLFAGEWLVRRNVKRREYEQSDSTL